MRRNQLRLVIGHAAMETVRTDERAQSEVSFERRARRANPDRFAGRDAFASDGSGPIAAEMGWPSSTGCRIRRSLLTNS